MKGFFTEIQWVPIDTLKPYEANAKKHPPDQVAKIAKSIQSFGFDQPIVVDQDMVIIKGHGRRLAALSLKLETVPIIIRTDLSAAEVRASRIADNQTADAYWLMTNLMKELEALYLDGNDLSLTGFSDKEIRTMLPGMMETEQDYAISGVEGAIPSMLTTVGFDGMMGMPIPEKYDPLSLFINQHDRIIVPVSGDKYGVASIIWCKNNGVDMSKVIFVDTNFGPRNWRWHDDYLVYLEGQFGVEIVRDSSHCDEWLQDIKTQGYPSKEKPWCCNQYRKAAISKHYTEDPEKTVVFIPSVQQEGLPQMRPYGKVIEDGVHFVAPFMSLTEDAIVEFVAKTGIKLNPLYQITDKYLCPLCCQYSRPDFAFVKQHDLDLWIRWMIYFGRAQFCREYLDGGKFAAQAVELICESIEPRLEGKYRKYALSLPDCPQPDRQEVREGDDYGWDPDKDKNLDPETRLDKPRGKWWLEKGHSDFFKKQQAEIEAYHKERGDMPLDQWLEIQVAKAKEAAKAEGWM